MNTRTTVIIPSGQTDSGVINTGDNSIIAIVTPAAFDGTTMSFLAEVGYEAAPGVSDAYKAVYDAAGTLLVVTLAADRHTVISSVATRPAERIKLKAGIAQTAARSIVVIMGEAV